MAIITAESFTTNGDTPKKIIVRHNRRYGILYWRKYCCPGEKNRSDTPLKPRKVFIISGNDACRQCEGWCWAPRHLETLEWSITWILGISWISKLNLGSDIRTWYRSQISELRYIEATLDIGNNWKGTFLAQQAKRITSFLHSLSNTMYCKWWVWAVL